MDASQKPLTWDEHPPLFPLIPPAFQKKKKNQFLSLLTNVQPTHSWISVVCNIQVGLIQMLCPKLSLTKPQIAVFTCYMQANKPSYPATWWLVWWWQPHFGLVHQVVPEHTSRGDASFWSEACSHISSLFFLNETLQGHLTQLPVVSAPTLLLLFGKSIVKRMPMCQRTQLSLPAFLVKNEHPELKTRETQ